MLKITTAALLVCWTAAAETRLSLSDAIAQALASHPQLAAGQARIAAAAGLLRQAGLRPNPRLILQVENLRLQPASPAFSYPRDTDNFAYLSQVFERGGKRTARIAAGQAGVQRAEVDQAVLARQIASRVASAYWSARAAAAGRDLLRQEVLNFERIVDYHRVRVKEGAIAEVDLLRVELERDRMAINEQSAAEEADRGLLVLMREMGGAALTSDVILTDNIDAPAAPVADGAQAVERRPEMRAARAAIEQARAGLRVQQTVARVDPELVFGYKRTAGLNTMLGGLQIALPFQNRNQGQIAAAEAQIRTAEAEASAAERLVRAEVALAQKEYEARRRLLDQQIAPMRRRADEIARIAQAAYREGGADLLRMLDAERARLEAQGLHVRALGALQQSATSLRIALGEPF